MKMFALGRFLTPTLLLVFALQTQSAVVFAAEAPPTTNSASVAGGHESQDPQTEPTAEEFLEQFVELVKDKKKTTEVEVALEKIASMYTAALAAEEQAQLMLDRKQGNAAEHKRTLRDSERLRKDLSDHAWMGIRFRTRDNPANKKIWVKSIWVFGSMTEHGSKYLWKAFEDKRFRKDSKTQAECIRQIGRTKDYSQYQDLLDLLKHHDPQVIAGAAKAFQSYGEAPGKIRKECTKRLVKQLESFDNEANGGDSSAGKRFGWAKGPMMKALTILTGQRLDNSLAWTRFWNKNKNNKKLWKD